MMVKMKKKEQQQQHQQHQQRPRNIIKKKSKFVLPDRYPFSWKSFPFDRALNACFSYFLTVNAGTVFHSVGYIKRNWYNIIISFLFSNENILIHLYMSLGLCVDLFLGVRVYQFVCLCLCVCVWVFVWTFQLFSPRIETIDKSVDGLNILTWLWSSFEHVYALFFLFVSVCLSASRPNQCLPWKTYTHREWERERKTNIKYKISYPNSKHLVNCYFISCQLTV